MQGSQSRKSKENDYKVKLRMHLLVRIENSIICFFPLFTSTRWDVKEKNLKKKCIVLISTSWFYTDIQNKPTTNRQFSEYKTNHICYIFIYFLLIK